MQWLQFYTNGKGGVHGQVRGADSKLNLRWNHVDKDV